ncbi:MAG: hypothetical protein UV58_C0002G0024 [Candidatus Wolfebacteria bacterium GW2011_GWC1_43_10]|uniref:Uncharacterized protein n=1 Tax=Candidatus Wolfebacteria bacterium GW2011_GWC1_43_10 TaxID=1619011 RepID=A0A0G1CC64_9BACT|nr:MAG: hypothetical protein UV58_C0002G0024 [Candidatus Wolfebacteria bacterium GW2011_GWC1_43_10]KKT23071.1 MAG: hypothetical protein UW08_C0001G0034 [Parcubacteria group bacterium GW2011_GWB1_43_8b]
MKNYSLKLNNWGNILRLSRLGFLIIIFIFYTYILHFYDNSPLVFFWTVKKID